MNKAPLILTQRRDFGQIIDATFTFVQQNFKPLARALVTYAGPFILIGAIFSALYQAENFMNPKTNPFETMKSAYYFLAMIFSVIGSVMMVGTVFAYIILYSTKGHGNIENEDIWAFLSRDFLMILGTSFLVGLMTIGGFLALIIPGIYLAIALIFIVFIRMRERKNFSEAVSRSFFLVKDNWWSTFGLLIVIYIIASVFSFIFMVPQAIYTFVFTLNTAQGIRNEPSVLFTLVTILGTFCGSLISSVVYITIALKYFSLVEEKENPSLIAKINQISEQPQNNL